MNGTRLAGGAGSGSRIAVCAGPACPGLQGVKATWRCAFMRRHRQLADHLLVDDHSGDDRRLRRALHPHRGCQAGQPPAACLAEVGGQPITLGEYQRAYRRQRERLRADGQGQLDPEMLERHRPRGADASQSLVDERLVALEAHRLGLTVDDETLAHEIATSPGLQGERALPGGGRGAPPPGDAAASPWQEFQESIRAEMLGGKAPAGSGSPTAWP